MRDLFVNEGDIGVLQIEVRLSFALLIRTAAFSMLAYSSMYMCDRRTRFNDGDFRVLRDKINESFAAARE